MIAYIVFLNNDMLCLLLGTRRSIVVVHEAEAVVNLPDDVVVPHEDAAGHRGGEEAIAAHQDEEGLHNHPA